MYTRGNQIFNTKGGAQFGEWMSRLSGGLSSGILNASVSPNERSEGTCFAYPSEGCLLQLPPARAQDPRNPNLHWYGRDGKRSSGKEGT
jgi:hypothetical protein